MTGTRSASSSAAAPAEVDARNRRIVHRPALDGLRGAAVAGVLLFHGGYLQGGYLGVDAFFVLSGFLITSLLLAESSQDGRIVLRRFWVRRARRLMPALALMLLGVALYALVLAAPEELRTIRGDALATLAYVANWRQVFASTDYFALFRSPSPLQHTWSLAIEEQFYLVWPLIVAFVVRGRVGAQGAKRVLVLSVALAAASFVTAQVLFSPGSESRVYYGTDTRAASILIGAALAAWFARRAPGDSDRVRRGLGVASIAAVGGLAWAWVGLPGSSPVLYRGGLFACGIATVVVIAACVGAPDSAVARALSWRPLRELGIVSYGVYLWHWPIYVALTSQRVQVSGLPLLGVRLGATLGVAYVSYRWIERPIRFGAGSFRQMAWAIPTGAVVLVGAIVLSTADAPAAQTVAHQPSSGGVMVVGDSVAHNLAVALDRAGLGVSNRVVFGCSLIRGKINVQKNAESTSCGPFATWARMQRPQYVLLVSGLFETLDFHVADGAPTIQPGTPKYARIYTDTLQRAIDDLSSTGATVIIPTIPCMYPKWLPQEQLDQLAGNPVRLKIENDLLAAVVGRARNRGRVVSPDLKQFVCPTGVFQRPLGSVADARPDGMHFTPAAADIVARWLIRNVPGLVRATAARHSRAGDVVDRFNATGLVCQFSRGQNTDRPNATTIVPCAYKVAPRVYTAELRVDTRPHALDGFEKLYRAVACKYAPKTGTTKLGYLVGPDWVLTGTAAPYAAQLLHQPLTYFSCP